MMDVHYGFLAVIYSFVIILLTSDFIMNLILGVFTEVFKDNRERIAREELERLK